MERSDDITWRPWEREAPFDANQAVTVWATRLCYCFWQKLLETEKKPGAFIWCGKCWWCILLVLLTARVTCSVLQQPRTHMIWLECVSLRKTMSCFFHHFDSSSCRAGALIQGLNVWNGKDQSKAKGLSDCMKSNNMTCTGRALCTSVTIDPFSQLAVSIRWLLSMACLYGIIPAWIDQYLLCAVH